MSCGLGDVYKRQALMGTFKFIQKFSEPISNLYSISDLSQINIITSEGIFSIQPIINIIESLNIKIPDILTANLNIDSIESMTFNIDDRICALMGTFKFIQKFSEPISNLYSINDLSQINITTGEGIFSIQSIMNIVESLNIKISDILTANLNIDSIESMTFNTDDRIRPYIKTFGIVQKLGIPWV